MSDRANSPVPPGVRTTSVVEFQEIAQSHVAHADDPTGILLEITPDATTRRNRPGEDPPHTHVENQAPGFFAGDPSRNAIAVSNLIGLCIYALVGIVFGIAGLGGGGGDLAPQHKMRIG